MTTDSDHNYIKENQFQENLFLLLKFLNLYCTCLKAYIHESFYYPLVMLGDRLFVGMMGERIFVGMIGERSLICWDDGQSLICWNDERSLICWDDERFLRSASLSLQGLLSMFLLHY
ncbi:hypothetical protein MEN95_20595 [Dolichospermum sp. ST_sed7]|nr:hypothetical protein [Dolichospermum sp. ST_sed7]